MEREIERLRYFLRQLRRRRWGCLAIAWLLFLPGSAVTLLWPDSFESEARIWVETTGLLEPLLKGLTPESDPAQRLEVMQRTLLSRPNLERVLERTGQAAFYPDPAARERAVDLLARKILVRPEKNNLFAVVYRARDPATARDTVQTLLDIFVESTIEASRRDMEKARRFIDEQIAIQERALEEAERRLAEFQKRNMDYLGGEEGYFQRLQQARTRVLEARTDLEAARARRDELRRQLAQVPQSLALATSPFARLPESGGAAAELSRLKRELAELQSRFTERHPRILELRRTIAMLEGELAAQRSQGAIPNPLFEQLRARLAAEEAEVASLENRLAKAEQALSELLALARTVPETEAELKRLTRDYEVIKRNYEELIARREAARIADDLDARRDRVEFRVVEPASLPLVPAGPPRLAMMLVVFAGALVAGVAFGVLRAALERPFESAQELREALALPVAGVFSVAPTARERRTAVASALAFGLCSSLLVGSFTAALGVELSVGTVALRQQVYATLRALAGEGGSA